MSMVFMPPTLRPPSLAPGGCTIPIQGPMPHFEAMPLDAMTMPMAMQPNLNNPCLLRQLRMPMPVTELQMVSKSSTFEENIRPRSSLIQDGSEFMRLLDSLEERVELMNKMQETRQRLQEAWEPSKNEPEGIEDGGLDQPEQEESGAQLLYDQLQHLSPISETPRWCRPDLLEQDAQHPSPANDEVDASYAADVRKLLIELERHLEESAKLREDLQMQREESARLRNDLQMEREESARLRNELQMEREESARSRNDLQMEREESARLRNDLQMEREESASSRNELQMDREERAREKASFQSQIKEMSKDLPKQASTDWDGGFMVGKNIAMSEDRLVATRSRGTGHTMVVGSSPIRKTLAGWYYEVRICEVESCGISYMDVGGLAIGVTKQSASPDIRMPAKAWRWPQTSILGYYGSAYLEGSPGSPQKIEWSPDAESLPVGSIVGLLVTHQGDIQVLVENEEVACLRGVMTLEPETELYPVLDIFSTTRSVELLRPVWSEGSRSVSEGTDGEDQ